MIKSYGLLTIIFLFSSTLGFTTQLSANQSSETQTLNEASEISSKRILVLGDSLSAAYGIPIEQAWVALLGKTLEKQFSDIDNTYKIINASISGETTDGGLRSLPALLRKYHPEVVIIELGANDGLRGFPLKTIERNLEKLIVLAQMNNAKVLLTGIHTPPNYGNRYASAFHQIYSKLAKQYNTQLLPFLLEGIATNPKLMQADGLHPKASAQATIKSLIWEQLEPMLTSD